MIPNINARLCLNVSGEALRGLCTLRIKDYDVLIARGESALGASMADLEEVTREEAQPVRRQRMSQLPPYMVGGGMAGPPDDSSYLRGRIHQLELSLANLKSGRARTQWLHDQIIPSKTYDIGTADLAMLGFSGAMHGSPALLGNIDPLVL
jgi:hypothetical protein